jgi:hypothetical protein
MSWCACGRRILTVGEEQRGDPCARCLADRYQTEERDDQSARTAE